MERRDAKPQRTQSFFPAVTLRSLRLCASAFSKRPSPDFQIEPGPEILSLPRTNPAGSRNVLNSSVANFIYPVFAVLSLSAFADLAVAAILRGEAVAKAIDPSRDASVSKDGRRVLCRRVNAALVDAGQIIGVTSLCEDIRARVALDEQRRRS